MDGYARRATTGGPLGCGTYVRIPLPPLPHCDAAFSFAMAGDGDAIG